MTANYAGNMFVCVCVIATNTHSSTASYVNMSGLPYCSAGSPAVGVAEVVTSAVSAEQKTFDGCIHTAGRRSRHTSAVWLCEDETCSDVS